MLQHSFCLPPAGTANVLRPTQDLQQAASQSTEASGKGNGLWTDGTGDDRINLEGLTEPLAFMDDASYNEVARARGGE